MIITSKISIHDTLSIEQIKRIEQAANMPIISDKDCPVYTREQLDCMRAKTSAGLPLGNSFLENA